MDCQRIEKLSFTAELPLPPDALSPNARVHYMARARATKQYRFDCALAFAEARPKSWLPMAVTVDIVYRCHRDCGGYAAKDAPNALSAIKATFDAAIDAGIVPSDARHWLRLGSMDLIASKKDLKGAKPGISFCVRAM